MTNIRVKRKSITALLSQREAFRDNSFFTLTAIKAFSYFYHPMIYLSHGTVKHEGNERTIYMNDMHYIEQPSQFTWEQLGNIEVGRRTLGKDMPVLVYRLFQYTLKDVLTRIYNADTAADLFRAAGHLAGLEIAKNILDLSGDFAHFIAHLQNQLIDLKIGILQIEQANLDSLTFTLTVSEDLDCSGLPIMEDTVCDYDEGFIAGILEAYTGKAFNVQEIDCWAIGGRTCRFTAKGME
jgi:predicted hydrocarbon binding protein